MKILHYCTAFEALFASSTGELTHQLAERVACFLEPPGEARVQIFKTFKLAYGFRSRIAHGGTVVKKDLPELIEMSIACDDYLRKSSCSC